MKALDSSSSAIALRRGLAVGALCALLLASAPAGAQESAQQELSPRAEQIINDAARANKVAAATDAVVALLVGLGTLWLSSRLKSFEPTS